MPSSESAALGSGSLSRMVLSCGVSAADFQFPSLTETPGFIGISAALVFFS
jgi:hypothetical protein